MEDPEYEWEIQLEIYEHDAVFFKQIMIFNGLTSIVVNGFVVWLIATKTPVQMKTYRVYLLNIVVRVLEKKSWSIFILVRHAR
jgi:hypothetical protein